MMAQVSGRSTTPADPTQAPAVITLHLLFYHKGNDWYAECLDLDLLTARASVPEAYRELLTEIELYCQTAVESGQWNLYVPRRAQASHWLFYYARSIWQELRGLILNKMSYYTFRLPFDSRGRPLGA
jgi:hypothetical protein